MSLMGMNHFKANNRVNEDICRGKICKLGLNYISDSGREIENEILTFDGAPNHIGRDFYCGDNPIINIWKLFKDYSKVELLNDLDAIRDGDILMDRFNTFLSMIGLDEVENVEFYNCIN